MWSICGVHDHGFEEREVFGTIRYMTHKGCERKFDLKGFVRKYQGLAGPVRAQSGQKSGKYFDIFNRQLSVQPKPS